VPIVLSVRSGFALETAQRDAREFITRALPGASVLSEEIRTENGGNVLLLTVAADGPVMQAEAQRLAKGIVSESAVLARAEITFLGAVKASAP